MAAKGALQVRRVSAGLHRHPAFLRCIAVGNLGCAEAGELVEEAGAQIQREGHESVTIKEDGHPVSLRSFKRRRSRD